MTRRPAFWIVFAALGIAGAFTALRLFTVAVPNVSIDITMDRSDALAEAERLSERFAWGPADARSAASFGQANPDAQTYVELEGGGRDAFVALAEAGVYQPYQWTVRRFAEGQIEESRVRFAPDGTPYGFRLQLAEDDPGDANLDRGRAREVAEGAAAAWLDDLDAYDLLESSAETLAGGRVDHTFVFERRGEAVADARFRLRLVLAGDRLAEVSHFVHVPEAFTQRYSEMRARNDTIALASSGVFILLFVLLGAGVGSALLLRQGWIEWRMALVWGGVTAALFGLNAANALPLAWMGYDTAVSSGMFVFQGIAAGGALALLGTPLLAFFFLAGESLGRRAFPEHLQQWRFWSPEVARSNTALGFTVAAYLLVGLQLGYVVLFYLGTSRLDGWWSPADALVQPDLLATYAPWLQAVSISLFASLWEESIFRAVPIACAALIGARFGRRNAWVWGMVLFQALVFAAGHANYPQQPAYARVVELTFPALMWGAVYVGFGLVPTILAHFLYDLALISSMLFASEAWFDQGVIVAVAAVPLAVVLWHRRGGRAVSRVPDEALNRAWRPRVQHSGDSPGADDAHGVDRSAGASRDGDPVGLGAGAASTPAAATVDGVGGGDGPASTGGVPRGLPGRRVFAATGLLGAVLWVAALVSAEPGIQLTNSRGEAVERARTESESRGFEAGGWPAMAFANSGLTSAHRYVEEVEGEQGVDLLSGLYLPEPEWLVRFVDWDAPPEERVEELRVRIRADGSVGRTTRIVAESRPADSWSEDEARAAAGEALRARGAPSTSELVEVSAEEVVRPARTDWAFTYRDPGVLVGSEGEARIAVTISGTEVTDVRRYIDTPEDWERRQRERASRSGLFAGGLGMMLFVLYGVAAIVAIVVWSRGGLSGGTVARVGLVAFLATSLSLANQWPSTAAVFTTAQPWNVQAAGAGFGLLLVGIVGAVAIGLVTALAHSWLPRGADERPPAAFGIAAGLLVAGTGSLADVLWGGLGQPIDYSGADTVVPVLSSGLGAVTAMLLLTSGILALAATRLRFPKHAVLPSVTGFGILAMGVLVVPAGLQESLWSWVPAGIVGATVVAVIVFLVGLAPSLGPLVIGTMAGTTAIEAALLGGYPGARIGGVIAAVVVGVTAWFWSRSLESAEPGSTNQSPVVSARSVGSE